MQLFLNKMTLNGSMKDGIIPSVLEIISELNAKDEYYVFNELQWSILGTKFRKSKICENFVEIREFQNF